MKNKLHRKIKQYTSLPKDQEKTIHFYQMNPDRQVQLTIHQVQEVRVEEWPQGSRDDSARWKPESLVDST